MATARLLLPPFYHSGKVLPHAFKDLSRQMVFACDRIWPGRDDKVAYEIEHTGEHKLFV
jgi:hypothetical protein